MTIPLQGKNILILSPSEWGDNAVSNMQIAALLSEFNTVAYIETMGGRLPRLSEVGRVFRRLKFFIIGMKTDQSNRGLDPHKTNIVSPLAIPFHGSKIISYFNTWILTWQIRRAMNRLEMTRPIIWSFSPRWEAVASKIDHEILIFHCVDSLHTYDNSEAFKRQYERTVRGASLVFTPGVLLERELSLLNSATYRIGHGCGSDHLALPCDDTVPADMVNIPEPRAIYAGTLANWLDYELLEEVARRLPFVSFVLIGYIHALVPHIKIETLNSLRNVFLLGYKNFDELPRYYRGAVIGLVPYQAENEHIRYSTPTKFLDYCAAGLPIVSTRYPAAESMGKIVACATTPDEFVAEINKALANNSPKVALAQKEFGRSHTWEQQVSKMCEQICARLYGK